MGRPGRPNEMDFASASADWTKEKPEVAENTYSYTKGCAGMLGKGWHVASVKDFHNSMAALSGSTIANDLGNRFVYTSTTNASGEAQSLQLQKSWGLFAGHYFPTTGYYQQSAPVVCVCGPSVEKRELPDGQGQLSKIRGRLPQASQVRPNAARDYPKAVVPVFTKIFFLSDRRDIATSRNCLAGALLVEIIQFGLSRQVLLVYLRKNRVGLREA